MIYFANYDSSESTFIGLSDQKIIIPKLFLILLSLVFQYYLIELFYQFNIIVIRINIIWGLSDQKTMNSYYIYVRSFATKKYQFSVGGLF